MGTDATATDFRIWSTFRRGLGVARQKALSIAAVAIVSRFVASQVVSGVITFSDTTFGLDLAPIEGVLVFFGSLVVMWFAVVPLAMETIEASTSIKEVDHGTVVTRIWHDVSVYYRALSVRAILRGLGLLLVIYTLAFVSLLSGESVGSGFRRMFLDSFDWFGVVFILIWLLLSSFTIWLSARWTVVFPVMIMEDASIYESLRRSWRLTKSHAWRLIGFGILLFAVVVGLSGAILSGIVLAIGLDVPVPLTVFAAQTIGLILAAPTTAACYYYLQENDVAG